jgi:hypothetical protein
VLGLHDDADAGGRVRPDQPIIEGGPEQGPHGCDREPNRVRGQATGLELGDVALDVGRADVAEPHPPEVGERPGRHPVFVEERLAVLVEAEQAPIVPLRVGVDAALRAALVGGDPLRRVVGERDPAVHPLAAIDVDRHGRLTPHRLLVRLRGSPALLAVRAAEDVAVAVAALVDALRLRRDERGTHRCPALSSLRVERPRSVLAVVMTTYLLPR